MEGVYVNKIPLTEDSKAIGAFVIIKIIKQPNSARKFGNIFLPGEHILNSQLIIGEIHDSGPDALVEGMNVGDLVFYDRLSAFGHPPEEEGILIVTNKENVIAKVTLEDNEVKDAIPFGDRLMVGEYKPEATEVGGILIAETAQTRSCLNIVHRLGVGNIDKDGNRTKFPFKEGDEIVMVYDKCVELTIGQKKCYIIHVNNVLGIMVDDTPKPKKKRTKKIKKKK